MTYDDKMERLRELGDLQGEMATKAANYAAKDRPELANRFERASYAAVSARTLMQAALMAEREAGVPYVDCAPEREPETLEDTRDYADDRYGIGDGERPTKKF